MDNLPDEIISLIVFDCIILCRCTTRFYNIFQSVKYDIIKRYNKINNINEFNIRVIFRYREENIYYIDSGNILYRENEKKFDYWFIQKRDYFRKINFYIRLSHKFSVSNESDLFMNLAQSDKSMLFYMIIEKGKFLIKWWDDAYLFSICLNCSIKQMINDNIDNIVKYLINITDWDVSHFISADLLEILTNLGKN